MSSVQTIALQRIAPGHVSVIAPQTWEQFCRGGTPLLPGDRKIDLLLLTLRDGVCEEIDPITLALDENGYLMRFDLQLRPLPNIWRYWTRAARSSVAISSMRTTGSRARN